MKYDWIKLERDFTTLAKYATVSLRAYAEIVGVPYNRNYQTMTKGWVEKRAAKQRQKDGKILEKIIEKEADDALALSRMHVKLYSKVLHAADKVLTEQLGTNKDMFGKLHEDGYISAAKLKNIAQVVAIAQKGQRCALGLDDEQGGDVESDDSVITAVFDELTKRKIGELDGGD